MAYLHICDICKCQLSNNDEKVVRVIIQSPYIPNRPYHLNMEICEDCAMEVYNLVAPLATKASDIICRSLLLNGENQ